MRRLAALLLLGIVATGSAGATSIARVTRGQLERDARLVFTGVLDERRQVHGRLERLRFRDVRPYRGTTGEPVTIWSIPLPGLELGVEPGRRYLVFADYRPLWGGPRRPTPMGYFQGVFEIRSRRAVNESNGVYELDELSRRLRQARATCGMARRGKAYFVRGDTLVPVVRHRYGDDLGAALNQLFRGPSRAERRAGVSSAIPPRARVLGWRQVGRVAEVDVSRAFPYVASPQAHLALAQLVYTVTQSANIDGLRLLVRGKPTFVSVGGGPARPAPPIPRRNFGLTAGRILVESPALGQRPGRPLCVSGSAVAFSGRLRAELLDDRGRRIAVRPIALADGPRGQRRPFEVVIRHAGRPAALVVSEPGTRHRLRVDLG